MKLAAISIVVLCLTSTLLRADGPPKPLSQGYEYSAAMRQVAAKFKGRPGVVLHVGDSITYSSPYGAWARYGAGKSADDQAVLRWMHTGKDDDSDGWWLCRVDLPGNRSHTACSGLQLGELLAGGRSGMLSLAQMLKTYRPQVVVLMAGTNDASRGRKTEEFRRDFEKAVELVCDAGAIPIVSTIPPHFGQRAAARSLNEAIRIVAKERQLPLIDFEQEILERRPDDWNGTLLNKDDVHPTTANGEVNAASAPTAENLAKCGYLLRGWLSVQKIAEVKRTVLDAPPAKPEAPPARSEAAPIRLPVTRDLPVSNVGSQADGNSGGASRWKLKSNQEMTLFDIDAAPLRGRVVRSATLHVRSTGAPPLLRVTVGSVGAEWVEGTAGSYGIQAGSSTFRSRRHPDVPWTIPGSDLCSVILGQGGTTWRSADAFPPDAEGWQRVAIEPAIVAARAAGLSHGFLAFDDTGSEWTRNGEQFRLTLFPNRSVHSRETNAASAPYVTVAVGERDDQPPAPPTDLRSEATDLPAGEAFVSWTTPIDAGPAGTLGFVVRVADREVPRYLIPLAGRPGERVRMRLRDLGLAAGATVPIAVRAVDAAGNVGPAAESAVKVSGHVVPELPGRRGEFDATPAPLPKLGAAEVAILDELDKVHPGSGATMPAQPESYWSANHLWNARTRQVRLAAARNEFVACQIVFRDPVENVQAELSLPSLPKAAATFGRYVNVPTANGPLPDPIVPLTGGTNLPKYSGLLLDIFVPHDARPGDHDGRLVLRSGPSTLVLPVRLRVWDFTLPDHLSFLPEMNCYGLPANERGYYRQAHRHRTVVNRVPYSQSGSVADGCAPRRDGQTFDWTAWDRRFGPLLDGSAFADLPRAGVPVDCFYLPLHENWPTPIAAHYDGDYWADRAFSGGYREAFVRASRQFAEHFDERGWNQTLFHFFLNGKNGFKEQGWSRGSSPWLLDEPSNFQDYWALAWFGQAFHEGVNAASRPATTAPGSGQERPLPGLLFRADISRPQWQRTCLDGLLDFNVVGGVMRENQYHRMVLDRKHAHGELTIEYGGTNDVTAANVQPLGWCLDAWSLGCDGVLPWQTVGTSQSWTRADEQSLFYPPRDGEPEPIPSIRLKAYRRGQQDVEYLVLLTQHLQQPRWAIGQRVREALRLSGSRRGTGFVGGEDAGLLHYSMLLPQDVWALRMQVGEVLSQARLAPRRRLVELRTPLRRPPESLPGLVSTGEFPPRNAPPFRPESESGSAAPPKPATVAVLQGRSVVRDALIDFQQPATNFGSVPRDNALRKADRSNAFLVRFDLRRLGLPADARIESALVSCCVWDPSSRGDTKLVALPLLTAWDEATVTWKAPAPGRKWRGGDEFDVARDTGKSDRFEVVKPDQGGDTAEPPVEFSVDVTETVRGWLGGRLANEGLALIPVPDRALDKGEHTRLQFYASEHPRMQFTPKLTIEWAK